MVNRVGYFLAGFFLNISSIRSVTIKPPTTFIVAKTTATKPIQEATVASPILVDATTIAPTRVIPEIALDPDIRGVCNVAGTLEISSKPTKQARIKTKSVDNI
jgi:hypothetical protein